MLVRHLVLKEQYMDSCSGRDMYSNKCKTYMTANLQPEVVAMVIHDHFLW